MKFFLITLPLAWFWWAQIYLRLWPENLVLIPSTLGGLSPILTLWLIERESDDQALEEILSSAWKWKGVIPSLLIAAVIFPALNIISKLLSRVFGLTPKILATGPDELGVYLIFIIPMAFLSGLITSPLFEEPAWRGYVYPKLVPVFGLNVSSLILGSYWWLWHQMMNLAFGTQPSLFQYVTMLGQSFIIDSLYFHSKRVILVAMFAHQSLFILNNFIAKPMAIQGQMIYVVVLWVTVVFLRMNILDTK